MTVDHVYGSKNLFKFFYIPATSFGTHCTILSFKKIEIFFGFLIQKYFFDVHGPFLCLQNDGNSLPKNIFNHIIDTYFNVFKKIE